MVTLKVSSNVVLRDIYDPSIPVSRAMPQRHDTALFLHVNYSLPSLRALIHYTSYEQLASLPFLGLLRDWWCAPTLSMTDSQYIQADIRFEVKSASCCDRRP